MTKAKTPWAGGSRFDPSSLTEEQQVDLICESAHILSNEIIEHCIQAVDHLPPDMQKSVCLMAMDKTVYSFCMAAGGGDFDTAVTVLAAHVLGTTRMIKKEVKAMKAENIRRKKGTFDGQPS